MNLGRARVVIRYRFRRTVVNHAMFVKAKQKQSNICSLMFQCQVFVTGMQGPFQYLY